MSRLRIVPALCLVVVLASAAGDSSNLAQVVAQLEQKTAQLQPPLAIHYRLLAARALHPRHPDLARKFAEAAAADLRRTKGAQATFTSFRALAEVAPSDAIALARSVPELAPQMMPALAQSRQVDAALSLYRESLAAGKVKPSAASPLISQLARDNRTEAVSLLQDSLTHISFDPLEASDGWWIVSNANTISRLSGDAAADACERVLTAASVADFDSRTKSSISATFQAGGAAIITPTSRDTLLLASAACLKLASPQRLAKHKDVIGRWDLGSPVSVRGYTARSAGAPPPQQTSSPEVGPIRQGLNEFRAKPSDADRARSAIQIAAAIRRVPLNLEKLSLARSLANLSTEGDLGSEALGAVAATLGEAVRETPIDSNSAELVAGAYFDLASLARFENAPGLPAEPAFATADLLLALRSRLTEEIGFTLKSLDGKSWSLSGLRGRVVLLNFWATWCPPCRKEMPDMEKLYRVFEKKGFTVLAVSDEPADTVSTFLAKQNYTFPVLLDPDRAVHSAFSVEGIPKSFLFDREGRLVAQAIDMRTERQFLEMLKHAGLE